MVFALFLIYAMTGDIVYADIKIDGAIPSEHSPPPARSASHHHGIFLKVECAMIIILLVIVIVLTILVIQFKSAKHNKMHNESKEKYCTGKNQSGTMTSTVSPNSSAHESCPPNGWKLHGGKCYWVALHKNSWDASKNDCDMKNSHLMVIRDFIDMTFLWPYLQRSSSYWIGLSLPPGQKSWTWVDNTSFDPHVFSSKENIPWTRSMKCAQVSHTGIAQNNCEDKKPWICQL